MNVAPAQPRLLAPDRRDPLTLNAQRWVSQTFFGTLLRQMHNSPFKSELFSGGRGGEAFSMLMDQHLAERMARHAAPSLADSIARRLHRSGQQTPSGPPIEHRTQTPRTFGASREMNHDGPTLRA